jgi:hypothetical protein
VSSTGDSQEAPQELGEAVALLDGVLQRDDVPSEARLVIADVYSALLDVAPPYAPIEPRDVRSGTWEQATRDAAAALERLVEQQSDASPARSVQWGTAVRTLRETAPPPTSDDE